MHNFFQKILIGIIGVEAIRIYQTADMMSQMDIFTFGLITFCTTLTCLHVQLQKTYWVTGCLVGVVLGLLPIMYWADEHKLELDTDSIMGIQISINGITYQGEGRFASVGHIEKSNWKPVGRFAPISEKWVHIRHTDHKCDRAYGSVEGYFGASRMITYIPSVVTQVLISPKGDAFMKSGDSWTRSKEAIYFSYKIPGDDTRAIKESEEYRQFCRD